MFLIGRDLNLDKNLEKNLNRKLNLKSLEYIIWVATKKCPGISDLMLFNSLEKTIKLANYFGLKLIIRPHPTITSKDIYQLYGDILKENFLIDQVLP